MVYNFLTNRSNFVTLLGRLSADSPVLSAQQGTVLGPLLFLTMMADINKDVSKSNRISIADDTQIYNKIHDVSNCNKILTIYMTGHPLIIIIMHLYSASYLLNRAYMNKCAKQNSGVIESGVPSSMGECHEYIIM